MSSVGYGQVMAKEWASDEEAPSSSKQIKKVGFFKRWMYRIVKEAAQSEQNNAQLNEVAKQPRVRTNTLRVHEDLLNSQPLNLKIYRANGGTIVETSSYDRKSDRHQNNLHIITHDVDLGEGLSKIITMESLRG